MTGVSASEREQIESCLDAWASTLIGVNCMLTMSVCVIYRAFNFRFLPSVWMYFIIRIPYFQSNGESTNSSSGHVLGFCPSVPLADLLKEIVLPNTIPLSRRRLGARCPARQRRGPPGPRPAPEVLVAVPRQPGRGGGRHAGAAAGALHAPRPGQRQLRPGRRAPQPAGLDLRPGCAVFPPGVKVSHMNTSFTSKRGPFGGVV